MSQNVQNAQGDVQKERSLLKEAQEYVQKERFSVKKHKKKHGLRA